MASMDFKQGDAYLRSQSKIRVSGLTKLDVLEMSDAFPADSVTFTDEAMPGGKHGELVSTAVIVLSGLAINALAAWLLKNRTNTRIVRTIEIVDDAGNVRKETIEVDLSSSTAPEADVLNALAKVTDFDLAKVLDQS